MAYALAWVLVAMVMRDTLRVREAGVEACDAPESGEANICGKGDGKWRGLDLLKNGSNINKMVAK